MNREEFFEKIEDMGFHIEYDQYFLYVLDKDNFQLASISTFYKYQFSFHHVGLSHKGDSDISAFINLVTEFVLSGAERREKKRDCFKGLCSDRCDNRPERADLSCVNLKYANLSDVDLDSANLDSADLSGERLNCIKTRNLKGKKVIAVQVDTSRSNNIISYWVDLGVWTTGCFQGTLEELKEKIEETHKDNTFLRERYYRVIHFILQEADEDNGRIEVKE